MDQFLQEETEKLKRSWMQHDQTLLRDYLVSSVEDPRLNVQSILTRHFLLNNLFGPARYQELKSSELTFAIAINWLQKYVAEFPLPEDAEALLYALKVQADDANGIEVPHFLLRIFHALPVSADSLIVPNYLRDALESAAKAEHKFLISDPAKDLFVNLWRKKLARARPKQPALLEPACGSANDYRFIDACGIARFFAYTGFDLCEKNVANANALFPNIDFRLGNVLEIDAPDKSFDFCIVHDLFEHLSPQAITAAVAEICRVTKSAACIGFFNMAEEKEHLIQPAGDYHWNRLSVDKMRKLFTQSAEGVQVLHIGTYLRQAFPDVDTHNENAYTFVVFFYQ